MLSCLLMGSCSHSAHTSIAPYFETPTEYLGDGGDGILLIRAYGQNTNRKSAIVQAQKNALKEIIFKGIISSKNPSLSRPLVTEVNAQERHEAFFNHFFADNGEYRDYVKIAKPDNGRTESNSNSTLTKVSITLRVDRANLKSYLKAQNIIK